MKLNLNNKNKTGFKTPNNYFNTVEDKIMSALKLESKLNQVNEVGFKTPNNYFDTLEDVIINKIEKKNTPKVVSLFTKRNILYASSIAASVLLLFNLSFFDKEVTWDSLDTETIVNYIIDEGIDSYELAALLSEDDFSEADFIEQNIADETLENYLLDNLDLEELIIE
ncbi:MAG: hypothetical protein DRI75_07190 [Bacteroidetes bacterium]|nr:MAG: hypothetical protein DRI75_07190 [Bacteroidota bacterium]